MDEMTRRSRLLRRLVSEDAEEEGPEILAVAALLVFAVVLILTLVTLMVFEVRADTTWTTWDQNQGLESGGVRDDGTVWGMGKDGTTSGQVFDDGIYQIRQPDGTIKSGVIQRNGDSPRYQPEQFN
jgi:hypothetical protein